MPREIAVCSRSTTHSRFLVTAHVTQGWVVDRDGSFLEVESECIEVTHAPTPEDVWTCAECGAAVVFVDIKQ